jgi:hypothetical protein
MPTEVRPEARVHAVVAVTPAEPALVALPALRVKLTAVAERDTVRDSARLALRVMVCALEFNCAEATEAERASVKPTIATKEILAVFIFPPGVATKRRFFDCMVAKCWWVPDIS